MSAPVSFKRLLGARVSEPTLEAEPSDSEKDKASKQQKGSRKATCPPPQEYPVETPSLQPELAATQPRVPVTHESETEHRET